MSCNGQKNTVARHRILKHTYPNSGAPTMTVIDWQWSHFADLSHEDVYELLKARQNVFIVEQNCVYCDADDKDQTSWHLLGWQTASQPKKLAASLRVTLPGVRFAELSIGRVITTRDFRGLGVGKQLMQIAMQNIAQYWPKQPIRISAQAYLQKFYSEFGFVCVSPKPYDEDGIPHVEMLYQPR